MNRPALLSLPAVRRLALAAPLAAGLALAAAVIPAAMASAAPAALPANCAQSGTTVTCTYTGAGTYAFTVPAGVSSLDVTAVGAPGGTTIEENNSGPGASVEDTAVSVSAGQVLPVIVGGVGANGTYNNGGAGGTPGGGGPGGDFPGGNGTAFADGGGGGGYSGLFSPSSTPLVIAAGGGGGGFRTGAGGPGDTGSGGGNGGTNGGGGGGGGTSTYGGNGGAGGDGDVTGGPGADGASLAGGAGGISNGSENSSGGGGGGGYYGGGGGGGGGAGGGGGGGSSFGISGLTNETTATGPASVTITYTAPPVSSTTTALSSSANPSAAGQQVTYTATVSPAPDGGTVAFSEGGTTIGACSAQQVDTSTGKATCQVTYTSPGSHSIAATYGGDNGFSGSGDTLTQTVNQAATTTAVTSSPNPSAAGQSVTFTATVSASSPGAGTPTGTVTFSEGSTTLGTGTLNGSGMATFSTSSLAAGGHSITVTYGGDEDFNTSHGSVTQTVNKIGTTTTVATSANPSIIGAPVTYTATVGPASGTGTPTGTVTFSDGGTPITGCGAVKVGSTGTATCPVTYTAVGSHAITAAYSADATYAGSTSTALTQQVAYKVQLLYSQTSPNNSGASVPVKLQLLNAAGTNLSASGITFTVKGLSPSPAPGKAPTGTFTFMTLDQGPGYQLNVKTTGYPAGTYTLSFTVSGDPTVHTVQFVIG